MVGAAEGQRTTVEVVEPSPSDRGPAASVAVVTTVFDGERHLGECLESALAQSLAAIDVVVVLDGCTDGSGAIARELGERIPHHGAGPAPGRPHAALNIGIAASDAPYVAVLDADDVAHPQRCEIQSAWLDRAPGSAGLVGSAALAFSGPTPPLPEVRPQDVTARDVGGRLRRHNPLGHSSVMVRRTALAAVGGYDVRRPSQVDYDLYVRLVAAGFSVHALDAPLVALRSHAGQSYLAGPSLGYELSSLRVQARALRVVPGPRADARYLPARAGRFALRRLRPAGRPGSSSVVLP